MATPKQKGRNNVTVTAVAGQGNFVKSMLVPVGQSVAWALNASGLYGRFPALRQAKVGLWGKIVPAETVLEDGDRIEVYTPVSAAAVQRARSLKRAKK